MATTIQIHANRYDDFYLAWVVDDEEGNSIGRKFNSSEIELEKELARAKADRSAVGANSFEYLYVELEARRWYLNNGVRMGVAPVQDYYRCESKKAARALLVACRSAIKAARKQYKSNVEWPEWAKVALAAGWKAPKGWKP